MLSASTKSEKTRKYVPEEMRKVNWFPQFGVWFLLLGLILVGSLEASAQCTSCTITFNGNGGPSPNRNIENNDVVCITGNRTNSVNLRNASNVQLCISTNVTLSGEIQNISSTTVVRNFGQYGTSSSPRNLTLNGTASSFQNNGTYFGNLTVTNGSASNLGTVNGNISLSNSSTFTNSGTQSGGLTLNGNSSLSNSGTLNLSSFSNSSGSQLTNTTSGTILIDQNLDLTISGPINNQGIFRFVRDNPYLTISSNITITNTGTFEVSRDLTNNGTLNSSNGNISVGRNLVNRGNGILNLGRTTVTRDFTNENVTNSSGLLEIGRDLINEEDGTLNLANTIVGRDFSNEGVTTLAGALEVGEDLTNEEDGVIRPLNTNQCNTILVSGDFENEENNGITGSNLTGPFKAPLLINKTPSNRGVSGGALVDPNLDCSCGATFSNTGSFIVPAGVTQMTIKVWGGGGKGGNRTNNPGASGGGGAGAYSEITITVTPGERLYYSAGIGSSTSNSPGGDSWVSRAANGSNPIVLAKGGASVAVNSSTGASGGQANQGVGTIRNNGGNGVNGGSNGGRGGNAPNGGAGGEGATSNNSNGSNGSAPGGGGGGAKTQGNGADNQGGNGGSGQVTFAFTCGETVTPPSNGCWRYIDDGSVSGVVIIEFFKDCVWNAPTGLLEFEVLTIGGGGGGGVRSGGGGGGGGAVHGRALVDARMPQGLPEGTSFEIKIGKGGRGSLQQTQKGENGSASTFDPNGDYEIIAGGGGGGGSDDNNAQNGNTGSSSSLKNTTSGFSVVSNILLGGAGGGGGHDGNGGEANQRRGGNADNHSGAGGGGLSGNAGEDAPTETRGGRGANGRQFSRFDATLNRAFGAGGGGGSRENNSAQGGNNGAGGNGGRNDGDEATSGLNATTPGSGGGGSGHDRETVGGNGADGVVFVRYEIARILPVEFAQFTATYDEAGREGELSWTTAKEWENSHFVVERAINEVKTWEKIDEVNGAGYSDKPTDYFYVDKTLPASGGNIFYRIGQVDFSGKITYSQTRAIRVGSLQGKGTWIAYPNPSQRGSYIHIDLLNRAQYTDEVIAVQLSNPSGTIQSNFTLKNPEEVEKVVNDYLQNQKSGLYLMNIRWGSFTQSIKLLVN